MVHPKQTGHGKNAKLTIAFLKLIKKSCSDRFSQPLIPILLSFRSVFPNVHLTSVALRSFHQLTLFSATIFKFPLPLGCVPALMMTHAPAQILMLRGNQTMLPASLQWHEVKLIICF